jgi:hypothetical protein
VADRNFDIIVLGDSLAARMAAISLAKKGQRILTLSSARPSADPWLFLSAALEDFLGQMGGRSCLTPPLPIQVLTPRTRMEIHGSLPLADELKREFSSGYSCIQPLLERIEEMGDHLEETIHAAGGLPVHGIMSRLRFARAGFARKTSRRALNRPFQLLLDECTDSLSREFLQSLMEGLSLTPAKDLTQGEAALLWRSALQPRSISATAFDTFLRQRYEQFHGETEESDQINSIESKGSGIEGVTLKDGRRCTADFFIIGAPEIFPLLPPSVHPPATGAPPPFVAELSEEKVSPMLAPRVILTGDPLLRITLTATGDKKLLCKAQPLRGETPIPDIVRGRLTSIFPFATCEVRAPAEPPSPLETRSSSESGAFLGMKGKVRLNKNLLNCCGQLVFPSLGSTGEVMLGLSCARQISRIKKL